MKSLKISTYQFLVLVICGSVMSYPTGAPSFICNSMVPGHPPTTTSGKPPYEIYIKSANNDGKEAVILGTLHSTNNSTFRGFLIEQVPDNGNYGVMVGDKNTSKNICGPKNESGLTHTDNYNKSRVDFTWTTLNSSLGDIQFRATVVESCCDNSRFWTNITSNKLAPPTAVSSTASPAPSPPTSTRSSSPTPSGHITIDPACGKSKGCFSDCTSSGCTYLVAWQNNNNNNITDTDNDTMSLLFDFKIKVNDTNNKWVSVGLSSTGKMDGTNVAACLSQTSGTTLESSYNDGYSNIVFNNSKLGLSLIKSDVADGIIHCQFTRAINVENQSKYLDLQDKQFMLVGTGALSQGIKQKHIVDPVRSPAKIDFMNIAPGTTPATPTISSPASVTPTTPGKIVYDSNCGRTKGCFSDCTSSGCTYLVTWQKNNNNTNSIDDEAENGTVLFDVKMKLNDTNNKWIAVGISPTGSMDKTNVAACLSQSSGVTLQSSYNNGYQNFLFNKTMLGLSLITGDVTDGVIHCQFNRVMQLQNETVFLDLDTLYYILVGSGNVLNGVIQKHDTNPVSSPVKINLLKNNVEPSSTPGTMPTSTGTPSTSSQPPPSGQIVYDPDCGVSKGCFPDCQNSECTFLVTWQKDVKTNELNDVQNTADVIFDIKMKVGNTLNTWIAVGISPKASMTGTSVAACLSQSSGLTLQSSYNGAFSNNLYSNTTLGLNLLTSDVSNGIIHCRFSRMDNIPSEPTFHDIKQTYFLVVAFGPVVGGFLSKHTAEPYKSQSRVNFLQNYVMNEDTSGANLLIKLHASLMVIAWVFLSSLGIVTARHCKTVLEHELYFKVKAWFLIHRKCMYMAVTLVIIAFIAIFVEVKGFSKISAEIGKEYTKAHPYTGIGATALSILNPILAIFRPSPTGRNRPIFNWIHFIVGNTAHIVAIITIFFGIELARAKVHHSAFYVMIAYCGIYVLVHFILEMYRRKTTSYEDKEQSVVNYHKLSDDKSESVKISDPHIKDDTLKPEFGTVHRTNSSPKLVSGLEPERSSSFVSYMLFIHAAMMLILAAFLVLIICLPQKMEEIFKM